MMKNYVKTVAVLLTAALALTGCAEKKENVIIDESAVSTTETTVSEDKVESTTSTATEEKPVSSTTTETTASKVEETSSKPSSTATSSSTTTSATTSSKPSSTTTSTSSSSKPSSSSSSKPSSSSSSNSSKPSSSTTTSSSKPTEKPVEEPVKTHDCSVDGHVWETTYTTTDPKWCYETHNVCDNGFDSTLARRNFPELENPYLTFCDTMTSLGSDGCSGSASVTVEVWGTETYKTETCTECGHYVVYTSPDYITPIGEWQFVNNKNLRWTDCNTLFYDPYNIDPKVVEDINNHFFREVGLI